MKEEDGNISREKIIFAVSLRIVSPYIHMRFLDSSSISHMLYEFFYISLTFIFAKPTECGAWHEATMF